jgi:hypothetical protein
VRKVIGGEREREREREREGFELGQVTLWISKLLMHKEGDVPSNPPKPPYLPPDLPPGTLLTDSN